MKNLAAERGWYVSDTAAALIGIGLRRTAELPDELPLRLPTGEAAAEFTVRIPVDANQKVREIAGLRARSLSIVTGALIQIGLQHLEELPGQIPTQYASHQEMPLTKAS